MTPARLPPWPARPVAYGPVVLRAFSALDVAMARELSTDPYVPLIGSLPANATQQEAQVWVDRQRGRLAEGAGFSFAIAEAETDRAVGGAHRRRTSDSRLFGYSERPGARHRCCGADRINVLCLECPSVASDRALHRAMERRLHQDGRESRL